MFDSRVNVNNTRSGMHSFEWVSGNVEACSWSDIVFGGKRACQGRSRLLGNNVRVIVSDSQQLRSDISHTEAEQTRTAAVSFCCYKPLRTNSQQNLWQLSSTSSLLLFCACKSYTSKSNKASTKSDGVRRLPHKTLLDVVGLGTAALACSSHWKAVKQSNGTCNSILSWKHNVRLTTWQLRKS